MGVFTGGAFPSHLSASGLPQTRKSLEALDFSAPKGGQKASSALGGGRRAQALHLRWSRVVRSRSIGGLTDRSHEKQPQH